MFILLVGPKGSGKSHIGRTLERRLGIPFFHVEPLWMAYHAECKASGREPSIAEGISRVHPRIAEALREHEHLCVETTGASAEILADLVSIAGASGILVARVSAPLDLCLRRIAARDSANQIPASEESVRKVHALSLAAPLHADLCLENEALSEDDIVSTFGSALTLPRRLS